MCKKTSDLAEDGFPNLEVHGLKSFIIQGFSISPALSTAQRHCFCRLKVFLLHMNNVLQFVTNVSWRQLLQQHIQMFSPEESPLRYVE